MYSGSLHGVSSVLTFLRIPTVPTVGFLQVGEMVGSRKTLAHVHSGGQGETMLCLLFEYFFLGYRNAFAVDVFGH